MLLSVSFITYGQEPITSKNQNIDTEQKYSIGFNISPYLGFILNGGDPEDFKYSVLFKKYNEKKNLRIGTYYTPGFINGSQRDYDIVSLTDTTMTRKFYDNFEKIFQVNIGIERVKKLKKSSMILGVDFLLGIIHKNNTYEYAFYDIYSRSPGNPVLCDNNDLPDCYIETQYFLPPNTQQPYYLSNILKMGLSFIFGYEWKLSKRFNVIASINPELYTTLIINQDFYDERGYYRELSESMMYDFKPGWINVYLSYKRFEITLINRILQYSIRFS